MRTVTITRLTHATERLWVHDHDDAEAIFVCCTNIPTYDLLGPLAQTLGKPVLTANEVLMHATLRALGSPAVDRITRAVARFPGGSRG